MIAGMADPLPDDDKGGRREVADQPTRPHLLRGRKKRRWWLEGLMFGAGYELYEWSRGVAPARPGAAKRHSEALWQAESWAHLNPEAWLNQELTKITPLAAVAGYYYLALNFIVPIILLIWLFRHRPVEYGRYRNVLAVGTGIGLLCFWIVPVAPPRFVVPGLTDTVISTNLIGVAYQNALAPLANENAAMPSLHIVWAGWCTYVVATACRRAWVVGLAWAYPFVTTMDIMATANHYLFDAVAGAIVLAMAYGIVVAAGRVRASMTGPVPASAVGTPVHAAPERRRDQERSGTDDSGEKPEDSER